MGDESTLCGLQAAVKAVQEAQKAARSSSEALPATPSLMNEQQSASAISTGALQGAAQSASISSGNPGAGASAIAHTGTQPDGDSTPNDARSKEALSGGLPPHSLKECRRMAPDIALHLRVHSALPCMTICGDVCERRPL
jgi:hypothetical protein